MNTYYLDLSTCQFKDDLYKVFQAIPAQVHPDNLDALYDLLTSITEETRIFINHQQKYQDRYPEYFNAFRQLCKDAMIDNNLLDIKFIEKH
ncbi:MAG TPA: hypothetical protein DDW57_01520 [Erysipelotrichaceae bacterium]|nr:hypothetical protein [Erysipelotrichaceae bacterium]